MTGVFNRSYYEDLLVDRVNNLVADDVWQARYEQINQFEKYLTDTGTTILKFFLHISKKEQKKRFVERLELSEKQWEFSRDDLLKREHWKAYQSAFENMLNLCTTPWAPWHLIPANQKWCRNRAATRVIVKTLRHLDPQFPPPDEGLHKIEIV